MCNNKTCQRIRLIISPQCLYLPLYWGSIVNIVQGKIATLHLYAGNSKQICRNIKYMTFFFFGLFPIWDRHIEFSISTFSGFVLLLFTCSHNYLLQSFSPHGLPISVIFSNCLTYSRHTALALISLSPLLLFLYTQPFQSSSEALTIVNDIMYHG